MRGARLEMTCNDMEKTLHHIRRGQSCETRNFACEKKQFAKLLRAEKESREAHRLWSDGSSCRRSAVRALVARRIFRSVRAPQKQQLAALCSKME